MLARCLARLSGPGGLVNKYPGKCTELRPLGRKAGLGILNLWDGQAYGMADWPFCLPSPVRLVFRLCHCKSVHLFLPALQCPRAGVCVPTKCWPPPPALDCPGRVLCHPPQHCAFPESGDQVDFVHLDDRHQKPCGTQSRRSLSVCCINV